MLPKNQTWLLFILIHIIMTIIMNMFHLSGHNLHFLIIYNKKTNLNLFKFESAFRNWKSVQTETVCVLVINVEDRIIRGFSSSPRFRSFSPLRAEVETERLNRCSSHLETITGRKSIKSCITTKSLQFFLSLLCFRLPSFHLRPTRNVSFCCFPRRSGPKRSVLTILPLRGANAGLMFPWRYSAAAACFQLHQEPVWAGMWLNFFGLDDAEPGYDEDCDASSPVKIPSSVMHPSCRAEPVLVQKLGLIWAATQLSDENFFIL